jgi:DNA-binding GntR family transcriptional regulator
MLLRDRVYRMIRQSILDWEFKPGQELREQILAEKYQISRSPIRDSLLRLEQEKLVTVLPRQGYRVTPLSLADAADVAALRLIIEPDCAAGAARASDAAVSFLDQFRVIPDHDTRQIVFGKYNCTFHNAVAVLAGNKRKAAVARDLLDHSTRAVQAAMPAVDGASVEALVIEHCLLIDAIQAHDAESAYRLAYSHAEGGYKIIETALRKYASEQDGPIITE